MSDDALKQFRAQIDRIDDELLRLFNQRAALAKEIGHAKKNGVVLRPGREAEILVRLREQNIGPLSNEAITKLFTEIMSQCRALEAKSKVAYLGPMGSFTESAVVKKFGGETINLAYTSIDEVFRKVEVGDVNFGVVPIENSTEGPVSRTLDLLIKTPLTVSAEVSLPIHHCLLVRTDQNRKKIQQVYGHPQALAQCQNWLSINLPNATRIPVESNSLGAQKVAQDTERITAAIASEKAANVSSLKIYSRNIEDDPSNTTRFLVISREDMNRDVGCHVQYKTSLILSAPNNSGAVHRLLEPLAKNGVSMTKLESRPARSGLWEYVFFVDIEGHQQDVKVAAALAELKQVASFVKILGSYPVAA
jgi:chorismate mutase/prephenate dehydratase